MRRLLSIFENAHERDPSIPRILPIATRRIFSPNRKRAAEPAEPAPKPAQPAPANQPK